MTDAETRVWLDGRQLQALKAELSVEQEWIDVRTMMPPMKPDMAWQHSDAAGHFHAFTNAGKLPTLVRNEIHINCDSHDDDECTGWTEIHHYCALCSEEVEPKLRPDYTDPQKLLGRKTWNVEVEVTTPLEDGKSGSLRMQTGDGFVFGIVKVLRSGMAFDGHGPTRYCYTLAGQSEMGERSYG